MSKGTPTKKPKKRPPKKPKHTTTTKTDTNYKEKERNQGASLDDRREQKKKDEKTTIGIETRPKGTEETKKPATTPESLPAKESVKSSLLAEDKDRQKIAKQLFGNGSPHRRWLVGMVATHGKGPMWAAQQFIVAFGTRGKTPDLIKSAIGRLMYQSRRFQEEVDKARQRMRMDLNMLVAQAPFILAPQRLASLSDLAEQAINKQDAGFALRIFKSIRDELEFAGAKDQAKGEDKPSVLSISFKDGQTSVEITLGDILGSDDAENEMKNFNPARADDKVRKLLEAGRKSALSGSDPHARTIDVDTSGKENELDDDDVMV